MIRGSCQESVLWGCSWLKETNKIILKEFHIKFCERGSVAKIRFVAEVNRWNTPSVTLLSPGCRMEQHRLSTKFLTPWPLISSLHPPVSHTPNAIHLQNQSLTGHFKDGGQDPHYHKCVCVSMWQSDHRGSLQTPAHTTKSEQWSMSMAPRKTGEKNNNNSERREKDRKKKRGRSVGDALVSKYWRSALSEKGFVCRGCFIFVCGSLPQSDTQCAPPGGLGQKGKWQRALITCSSLLLHFVLRENIEN